MSKRILVTGVAGFLGSHVADRMIELGYEVVGVDNLVGGFMENVNPKVEFYQQDCSNFEKMKEIVAAQGGDSSYLEHTDRFKTARYQKEITGGDLLAVQSAVSGEKVYLAGCDNQEIGMASLLLGG